MEYVKITDLCDDLLKSIEIEVKYTQREKIQRDLKDQITHFFNWFQYEFAWWQHESKSSTPAPSWISQYEENYDSDIRGDWLWDSA